MGQYVIYRALFEEYSIEFPLFLAVLRSAYEGILSEPLGEIVRRRLHVKIIVFDEDAEEIVEWLS